MLWGNGKEFIITKPSAQKDIVGRDVSSHDSKPNAILDLKQKQKTLAKATAQRDDDFKKFMDDLQTFSSTPSATADENTFKSGIKSYLKLIDDDTSHSRGYQKTELPTIDMPSRLDTLKGKLESLPSSETQRKSRETAVGKVKSIFGQGKNFGEKQNDSEYSAYEICENKGTYIS